MQEPAPTNLDVVAADHAPAAPNRLTPDRSVEADPVWSSFCELAPPGSLSALLESVAAAAARLAGAEHVRAVLLPNGQGHCNGAPGGACCAAAVIGGEWMVPLASAGLPLGELRLRGGNGGENLRRFAELAALRLHNERLALQLAASSREAGQRERLLHQREDERAWLHSVIERSPVGILLVELDEGTERTTANQRAAELLGHPVDPERARPMVAGRLLRPDGTVMSFDELPSSRALRGERVSMEEAMLRRPDDTVLPVVVSAGPIVDASGCHAGAVVTFDDISPFKELERLREQWTSLITHDLRQPITSIGGFAGVLAEHPDLPEHLRSKVVHIVAAAKRLGRMTGDLLEASRLESNQLALDPQPTDLSKLVRAIIERLAPELQDHPVAVEVHARLPQLRIDPERFEQVLGNLLSNAAKYSPPGTPIAVELDRHEGEVVIGVTNEGQGLPAAELGNLFQRYHRTDQARRSRVRGLGLGLYIARGLVEAHQGRIWAETDPGRTVTFRFALPLER